MKPFILLLLLCSTKLLPAQNKSLDNSHCKDCCEIKFSVDYMAAMPLFFVIVKRNQENISIVYKLRNKIDYDGFEKDKTTIRLRKKIDSFVSNKSIDSLTKILVEFDSVHLFYTSFDSDSISIARSLYSEYDLMLDKLFSTPVQELEKAGEGIVMDGSRFYFIFKNADTLKKAYGHSINSKRCPQLALFVKETMGF